MAKSPSKRRNDWSPMARWQESSHCKAWACAAAMSPANNPLPSAAQQRYSPTIRDHRPPPAAPYAAPAPFVAAEPESCQTRPRPWPLAQPTFILA